MNISLIITLILLFVLVLLFTYMGLKFSLTKRKGRGLTQYFFIGLFIGIIGGFIAFYNIEIIYDKVYFTIHFKRWWLITIASIILGAVLSIYISWKVSKK